MGKRRATHDDQIVKMRKEGHTLQAIGDAVRVSKQRVAKILREYYPDVKPPLTESRLKGVLGCSEKALPTLRQGGVLHPRHLGMAYLYDEEEIEKARSATQKHCVNCGKKIPYYCKRCDSCRAEYRRYRYPFLNDEQKKRALEASSQWRKRNRSRTKEGG